MDQRKVAKENQQLFWIEKHQNKGQWDAQKVKAFAAKPDKLQMILTAFNSQDLQRRK